jgi:hypothetical protein
MRNTAMGQDNPDFPRDASLNRPSAGVRYRLVVKFGARRIIIIQQLSGVGFNTTGMRRFGAALRAEQWIYRFRGVKLSSTARCNLSQRQLLRADTKCDRCGKTQGAH